MGNQKGTIATKPGELDVIIRETYGKIYKGQRGRPDGVCEEYHGGVQAVHLQRTDGQHRQARWGNAAANSMGRKRYRCTNRRWASADLTLVSPKAFQAFADMLNAVEAEGDWLEQMGTGRAAFSPKDEYNPLDPAGDRVLMMLRSVYRLWARTRPGQLETGVPGHGAADAAYTPALFADQCHRRKENFTGGPAGVYTCLDQIVRPLSFGLLKEAGWPEEVLQADIMYLETLALGLQ